MLGVPYHKYTTMGPKTPTLIIKAPILARQQRCKKGMAVPKWGQKSALTHPKVSKSPQKSLAPTL